MDCAVVSHHRDRVSKTPSPQMNAANQLFNNQKWEEAAKAFEVIVAAEPDNARAWYQLGLSRFSLTQFEPSIRAFEKNIAITKTRRRCTTLLVPMLALTRKTKRLSGWRRR
jgi:tetratricopeptide (TPR) repeat protein